MKLIWLQEAVFDLQEVRHYIAQDNPLAANKVAQKILQAVNLLSEQPEMGRSGRILHARELIILNTPYIIPYRVRNNSIEILRVYHCAMEWPEKI